MKNGHTIIYKVNKKELKTMQNELQLGKSLASRIGWTVLEVTCASSMEIHETKRVIGSMQTTLN